jgi:hypothetical protein
MGVIILFFIIPMLITKPNCRCIISGNYDKNLTLFPLPPTIFVMRKGSKILEISAGIFGSHRWWGRRISRKMGSPLATLRYTRNGTFLR